MFIGALMGFVGVGLGAFGAHGLKGRLPAEMLAVFETGVRYQMYHALALLALGALMSRLEGRAVVVAGWSFTAGILIFSGSLYALALSGVTMLGAITPIGGVAFLIGWIALAIAAFLRGAVADPGSTSLPTLRSASVKMPLGVSGPGVWRAGGQALSAPASQGPADT